jgi:RNA polymerase sigma factor (sigma-70 family)
MKWYSHPTYKSHLSQMKTYKKIDPIRAPYIDWPRTMANSFERSYARVGVLDLNDLVQEGYVSFYKAWNNLDWNLINKSPENERPGIIINYLKLNIKNAIKRAIARDRDTIRIPESYYTLKPHGDAYDGKYTYQTDIFLTRTFSSFFNADYLDIIDEIPDHENDQLNAILHHVMEEVLTPFESEIVCKYYGIDEPNDIRVPISKIADWFKKSVVWIKKSKAKAMQKLRTEDVRKKVEKFLEK